MAGLSAGEVAPGLSLPCVLALALGAGLIAVTAAGDRQAWGWSLSLIVSAMAGGYATDSLRRPHPPAGEHPAPAAVRLALRVERVYPSRRLTRCSGLALVIQASPPRPDVLGRSIYYSLALPEGQSAPERSATLSVSGTLSAVRRPPRPGSFDDYLGSLGLNFRLARGRVLATAQAPNVYYRCIERLARRMYALLGAGLEDRPTVAGVYRAMMLGRKGDLTRTQKDAFLHSGTMHLFAINGLHIDVVSVSVHALLALLRCPLVPGLALVLGVLWLDVSSTGNTPSATRSFLMIAGAKASQGLRLPGNPLAALAAAATAVLLLNPNDYFGASFEMSYGVVVVLLTFGLPLSACLQHRFAPYRDLPEASWSHWQRGRAALQRALLGSLAIGSAATLVGAVTGVHFFGLFAPSGLAANLVLAPPAMLVIVAGFASLVVGLPGWVPASRFFNGAAAVLLTGIDGLVRMADRLPGGCFSGLYRAAWVGPAALAALVLACLLGYVARWRADRGGFWPPFAIVALTMVAGVKWG